MSDDATALLSAIKQERDKLRADANEIEQQVSARPVTWERRAQAIGTMRTARAVAERLDRILLAAGW